MANVLITGAGRGIGLELTRQYAEAGDRVCASVRNPEKATILNTLASNSGGHISVHAMDVGNADAVRAAARDLGDVPIDILINNAGILGGEHQGLEDMNFDDWAEAFNVMTMGPFRVVQAFLKNLEKSRQAKVLTVTSQLAASTWPYGGMYAYSSAKAAVNKVVQILAIDLKDKHIISSMIHPGWVKTDLGGPEADITPQESATGIRKVIASLTPADSGKFFKWNGDLHPL